MEEEKKKNVSLIENKAFFKISFVDFWYNNTTNYLVD